MASRSGWTFNGKHFAETATCRMSRRRVMYFIDGKPTPEREWRGAMNEARKADADKQRALT